MKSVLKKSAFLLLACLMVAGSLAGCTSRTGLKGSGATFPQPLYELWFGKYYNQTGIQVNYGAGGSGTGISDITNGIVNFGASDALLTPVQLAKFQESRGDLITIPTTSGAVAIIYNIDGVGNGELCLSGEVLADIYLGKIKKWNDSAIVALNPSLSLPKEKNDILVMFRSSSSGTTNIFTTYLSQVSPDWAEGPQAGTAVKWPVGLGHSGSTDLAGAVKNNPNAIGYVELAYATQNNVHCAKMRNKAGNDILPSLESATAASEGVSLPDDMRVMITNSPAPQAYPIVGFTWILVCANQTNQTKGQLLVDLLWWVIHDGQEFCSDLGYPRLSTAAVLKAEALIRAIKYDGQQIYTK